MQSIYLKRPGANLNLTLRGKTRRTPIGRSLLLSLVALLLVSFGATGTAHAVTPCPAPGGADIGMCLGMWTSGNQSSDYSVENNFPIAVNDAIIYAGWLTWPVAPANAAQANGYEPFVKFAPNVPITQVVSGNGYDSTLDAFADSLSAFGHPAYVQYAGEFNGVWTTEYGYTHYTPSQYVTSYRYVVSTINNRLAADGTPGLAQWVFAPNACNSNASNCSASWPQWWPGNSYVDVMGIDGYANASSDTFSSLFQQTVNKVGQAGDASSLPLIVGESGIESSVDSASKIAAWVHGACSLGFRDLYYFNDYSNASQTDYTLSSNEATAMASALQDGSCYP